MRNRFVFRAVSHRHESDIGARLDFELTIHPTMLPLRNDFGPFPEFNSVLCIFSRKPFVESS
jgi:hypothetical protein